jgi:hypothetical protein
MWQQEAGHDTLDYSENHTKQGIRRKEIENRIDTGTRKEEGKRVYDKTCSSLEAFVMDSTMCCI